MISSYREYLELRNLSTLSESEKHSVRYLEMKKHGPYVRYCDNSISYKTAAVFRPRAGEASK
jgi:hypothetical protein